MDNAVKNTINKPKKSARYFLQGTIKYACFVIFILYAITLIFPLLWALLSSFRDSAEFFHGVFAFPKQILLENYTKVIVQATTAGTILGFGENINIFGMFVNSIVIVTAGSLINVFLSACTAYIIAKYKFFGRGAIFNIAIFFMIVPIIGGLPAQVKLMEDLHLDNTIWGLLFLYSYSFGFNFLMMYGYFKNLSASYAEAAFMDGANDFQVFGRIMLPLAMPSFIALFVLHFIGLWNDYSTPFLFAKSYPTLSVGLNELSENFIAKTEYPALFACIIITVVPVLALFAALQKQIIKNTVSGGLKG